MVGMPVRAISEIADHLGYQYHRYPIPSREVGAMATQTHEQSPESHDTRHLRVSSRDSRMFQHGRAPELARNESSPITVVHGGRQEHRMGYHRTE